MIDCGATALFLDQPFVTANRITMFPLRNPIRLLNIDGSPNTVGNITHFARLKLTIGLHSEWTDFLIADLGGENVILGLPWLRKVNPLINWTTGSIRINPKPRVEDDPEEPLSGLPRSGPTGGSILEQIYATPAVDQQAVPELPRVKVSVPPSAQKAVPEMVPLQENAGQAGLGSEPEVSEPLEDEFGHPFCHIRANRSTRRGWVRAGILEHIDEQVWCAASFTYSQQIAEEAHRGKPQRTFEEMVPSQY